MIVTGWDIGGVNTKAARVEGGTVRAARTVPYELQRAPDRLPDVLRALAEDIGGVGPDLHCAVTMTAELSQLFRTKREGVGFVLDSVDAAFPAATIDVFTVDGAFVPPAAARQAPLAVAAANWAATAAFVAQHHTDVLLVDVGTTTADIVPIVGGRVVASGRTDPERLASGELVYTGAVRTPAEAILSEVPFRGGLARVSAEGFALAGDVHVWRGDLRPEDYTWATPDGRPATRQYAGERLARVVCADRELLGDGAIDDIANALAGAQAMAIAAAMRVVAGRHAAIRSAVVTGHGAFLGARAAVEAGLEVVPPPDAMRAVANGAPAACVALLLEQSMRGRVARSPRGHGPMPIAVKGAPYVPSAIPLVVKLGGGIIAHRAAFDAALGLIARRAREQRLLVVPGGGPFADVVRDVGRRFDLTETAAHWMAILGMDQYGCLLASRLDGGVIVESPSAAQRALGEGRIPVLAPFRWLREDDPLPHSWDVTSDTIAAWVAGQVGAEELVLIKPPGAHGGDVVDPCCRGVLPAHVTMTIVPADRLERAVEAG